MSIPDDTVILTKEQFHRLLDDSRFLDALRGAGVDNWEGYDLAVELYREDAP